MSRGKEGSSVHGTQGMYQQGCRCEPCRADKARVAKIYYTKYRDKDRVLQRNRSLKHFYGITSAEYDEMLAWQRGVCRICNGRYKSTKRLAVDHDHKTNQLRGLLCYRCNTHLAWVEEHMGEIVEYLNGL